MRLAFRYRLYPTKAQDAVMTAMLGAFCDLYNAALQQRIEAYRRRGTTLRYGQQAGELKAVREADERLSGFSFSAEQQILRRLDKAFAAFFRRLKTKAKAGFPRFRAKSQFDSAEFRVGDGLTLRKSGRLGIVGVPGEIKVKWHRDLPPEAKVGAAVLSRSCGKWFVCFQIEVPDPEPAARGFRPVGVDAGLTALVTLSTGERVETPQWTKEAAAGLRRRQRAVARKPSLRSRRRAKARMRLARYQRRVANRRRDFLHKLSRSLADRFTHIAFEDLNVAGMVRSRLAKAISNAAWGTLRQFTSYKAASAGSVVADVRPHGTSIDCSGCGEPVPKGLSDREHRCPRCGLVMCRDWNAAINIERRAEFGPGTGLRVPSERVAA